MMDDRSEEEDAAPENESKKARLEDSSSPEDRQPDTVEQMDEAGTDAELGPLSSRMLLALFKRAIREERVAKSSELQNLEAKVDHRFREVEDQWQQKFTASEAKVASLTTKVDTSLSDLGAQMSKLESRLDAMANRSGSNSSTASPSSWASRDQVASKNGLEGPPNMFAPKSLFIRGWAP